MSERYTLSGTPIPRGVPACIYNGIADRREGSFAKFEQLYRRPWWKKAGYRLGWLLGGLLTP